ncbi:glycoside hydrolase family 57 protein [Porphyromonas catoniae]|uniref:Glycoside hydrolase, family 57 n=1 Tax=Porphyromonas catoniae ATCC 51270 TaxID=887901 RepID=Z4WUZ5_9PORP|nr:glycoside hydrolase family 57 protein [Porphyromonas catoniae]EWC91600.1 glycoside hydrolase, family 57 [Porphyromonas catoniae ATCC 51270]
MKKICLCFQIHQPYRLRRYRFFDIGNSHYYSDDYLNEEVFERIADTCYLPANRMLLELLKAYPDFSVSFSLSGLAIEQMEYYKPELIDSFKELVATGRVELLAESYAHSISSLYDSVEFRNQVRMQQTKLRELFGVSPSRVFCNTELIYSDDIALELSALGYEGIITEGAKHVLGWKSPNYLYTSAVSPKTTLLLHNANLTELITSHFSNYASAEYPVTADKLLGRVKWLPEGEDFVCLYMNYEVLGVMNRPETGIFEFFRALPALAANYEVSFTTPSRLLDEEKSVGALSVAYPISWAGEEKSTNEWNGNILQQGAIEKLRAWGERVHALEDRRLLQDWLYLQSADHFYYMNTVNWGGHPFSPYSSPYDAFNNYMNVLSDLLLRVEEQAPSSIETEELNSYQQTIRAQDEQITHLENEVHQLRKQLSSLSEIKQ